MGELSRLKGAVNAGLTLEMYPLLDPSNRPLGFLKRDYSEQLKHHEYPSVNLQQVTARETAWKCL